MRDSLGQPAPLSVNAFDATGNLIANTTKQFFITDSAPVAHFVSPGLLMGDTLGMVHVVGQVNGVQTPVTPIQVTVAPVSLQGPATPPDTIRAPQSGDTTKVGTAALTVTLNGATPGTFTQGFIVRYVILSAPITASTSKSPAVFLAKGTVPQSIDTTGISGVPGQASLNLVVVAAFLGDTALLSGQTVDSAVVTASTSYKGVAVNGSPKTFVVPIIVVKPQ